MSHSPERKEKNCLNCGTIVQGKYCHVCGQENIEPKESFGGMVLHFFYDITHFDGKFFSTIKVLFQKPGLLTEEYLKGKRSSYLHPVRMYVFTSALFFFLFFTFFGISEKDSDSGGISLTKEDLNKLTEAAYKRAKDLKDSAIITNSIQFFIDTSKKMQDTIVPNSRGLQFSFDPKTEKYSSVREYDSIQKALPSSEKDGWLMRFLRRKMVDLNVRYKGRPGELGKVIVEKFLHMIPYLLFVSLPLYALFLRLIYIRRRKQFFYVDHGLFLVHLYIFTFIIMLLLAFVTKLRDSTGWEWLGILQFAFLVYGIGYTLFGMKRFYKQNWWKTILKFILFNILSLICLLVLFIIFFGVSVYLT